MTNATEDNPARDHDPADGSSRSVELEELIARVETTAHGDRLLDGRVWCAARGYPWLVGRSAFDPPVTTSIDAALALVERVLPGWGWSVGNLEAGGQAYLMRAPGAALIGGKAATPALALCSALLRAVYTSSTKEQSDG